MATEIRGEHGPELVTIPPGTHVLDRIEAQARVTMARIARLDVRGWDSERERADEIAVLDVLLDQANDLRRKG